MIQFNALEIAADNSNLTIDVSIEDISYFDDMYIDTIYIDDQNSYISTGPSSHPIYTYEAKKTLMEEYNLSEDLYSNFIHDYGDSKNIRIDISSDDLAITDKLLFVYIVLGGTPSADIPYVLDTQISLGIVYNKLPIFNNLMNYIKPCNNSEVIPLNFINYFLRLKELEISIDTGHYTNAIEYWKKFIIDKKAVSNVSKNNYYDK